MHSAKTRLLGCTESRGAPNASSMTLLRASVSSGVTVFVFGLGIRRAEYAEVCGHEDLRKPRGCHIRRGGMISAAMLRKLWWHTREMSWSPFDCDP